MSTGVHRSGQPIALRRLRVNAPGRKREGHQAERERREAVPEPATDISSKSVFLNIPYDGRFRRLCLAYIAGLTHFGLRPRATVEIPGGRNRLEKIFELVQSCPFSIHDLSRVQLDRTAPAAPRFNMPFELGLAVACSMINVRSHDWFVFESVPRQLSKSLSDLSGIDPYIHRGTVVGVLRELCNAFSREAPGRTSIRIRNDADLSISIQIGAGDSAQNQSAKPF